jgi:predicted transcriptional regulator of viral defense system
MKDQEYKELLLEAINHYALLSLSYKKVLKILVQIAIDDTAIINIKDLTNLSGVSRISTYHALQALEREKFIEKVSVKGSKLGSFIIKPKKIQEIINHYSVIKNLL